MNDWFWRRHSFIIALQLQIKYKLHEHKWFYWFSTVFNISLECKLITTWLKKKSAKALLQISTRCMLLLCGITVSIPPARWRGWERHFKVSATLPLSMSDLVVSLVPLRFHGTNNEPAASLRPPLAVLPFAVMFAKSCVNRLFWSWRRNAAEQRAWNRNNHRR